MRFRLLGPLEIVAGEHRLTLTRRRERWLLAILLLETGRVVSTEQLIGLLWEGDPPRQARRAVQSHVARIRATLARAGPQAAGATVSSRHGGYVVLADPHNIDVCRFRSYVRQAQDSTDPAVRWNLLRAALREWRGPVLDGDGAEGLRTRLCAELEELRLFAVESWAAAGLAQARYLELIPTLADHLARQPTRERLAELQMRAMCGAGRPVDALAVYHRFRGQLADELGLDPGPTLRGIHDAVLRGEPVDPPAVATRPTIAAEASVPRQLPAPPRGFTGRAGELAALDQVHDASAMVIAAIDGMAGVGKTALALHAAHRMAGWYPDGQLFIDLHGHTDGIPPIEPGAALDLALQALGVPPARIPAGLHERAALYRSELAGRKVLIVLDNAGTEAQVTPLLPGAPGCLVLVTSRRRLAGLDHFRTLSLDTLPDIDAVALFTNAVGDGRLTGAQPGLLTELVELCGRLPLAIRIAAARMRSHSAWTVTHLIELLADRRYRLDELTAGQRSVTATLDLSYQDLGPPEQRTYCLLGMHPGVDVDAYAVAALLGSPVRQARLALDRLLEAHLLDEPIAGRFRFHDLIRAHARHVAALDGDERIGRLALHRLLDHYRHAAATAMDAAYPDQRHQRPRVPCADSPAPPLADARAALEWLDHELPNLLAAAECAKGCGMTGHVLDLSTVLRRYLRARGRFRDALTLHGQALIVARATGDRSGELDALNDLAGIHRKQGQYKRAATAFEQALALALAIGRRQGELEALIGLGLIHWLQGRHARAAAQFERVLQIARTAGHRQFELEALRGLGRIHLLQRRYAEAATHFEQVRAIARAVGHQPFELDALSGLGRIHVLQGRYAQAGTQYLDVLRVARTRSDRFGEMEALHGLGHSHRLQGQHREAADHYHQLLELARRTGDRNWQFEAWQGLGWLHQAAGDPDISTTCHIQALALADELCQPQDQARAHDGLAHACLALSDHHQARDHWRRALTLLSRLDIDHTDDEETTPSAIRTRITQLNQQELPR